MPRAGVSFVATILCRHGIVTVADTSGGADGGQARGFGQINEALLARYGGGWDAPPDFPAGWETSASAASLRPVAADLLAAVSRPEPWAWSDPATALTLPFWNALTDRLVPLVVIRNPLEVMLSLHARTGCSLPFATDLVRRYLQAILATTTAGCRVVTHYAAYARDSAAEASRVVAALGCPPVAVDRDARGFAPCLRHATFAMPHLHDFAVPADIIAAYETLCVEAAFQDDDGDATSARDARGLDWLRTNLLDQATAVVPASGSRTAAALAAEVRDLREDVARLRHDLAARDDSLQEVLEDLRFLQAHLPVSPKQLLYREMVRRARTLVRQHVPERGIVAVISKGDDELLRHRDREGWHFPRDEGGTYAGWYPACDLAAIAHLETLRTRGATHLLVPEPYAWWLTSYPEFHRHLEHHGTLLAQESGTGTLYALEAGPKPAAGDLPVAEAIARLAAALGRPPQVLDLVGGGRVGELLPGVAAFTLPDGTVPAPQATLPHVDSSIDVVAVAEPSPGLLAEARRVAALAVVECGADPTIERLRDPPAARLPSVSIVVPVCNNWPMTRGCLQAIWATAPPECDPEVIVIDDASTDDTPRELASLAAAEPRLRVLRNASNLGFVETCNRAAAAATGDILVFLNNDTVPLPGWLEPLLRTFDLFPSAGAVGGKLLFPDGRLQEAGGILFSDASACHFGRGEANAMAPLFNYVRQVDYVSGALLATPRPLFASLGGFDPDFAPGYYEDTDYCFRLRERGHDIYYQPESAVVHLEGATAGTDHAVGMKRYQEINRIRFRARHAAALAGQRQRPASLGGDSWPELAHRGKGRVGE
ncbi:MAG: glycosyltransferase [Planctomycetaceae bacterium]